MLLSWDRENYISPKVTKLGVYNWPRNGVGVLRGQRHIPSKNLLENPHPRAFGIPYSYCFANSAWYALSSRYINVLARVCHLV